MNGFKPFLKFFLIFILIFSWLFSGWPQVFNFPPKIPHALAALPGYRSSGTFTAGTGAITPPYPADMAANDVCLLAVSSEAQAITLTTANGFVEVPTWSPQSAGTAATDPGSTLALFWKRTVGGDSAPTVADSINNTEGVIHCFSGVITTGDPWDTGAGGNDGAANDTTGTIPGATTSVADALVVLITSTSFNGNSTVQCSGWTNADLANILERQDNTNTAGLGGGSCMATGEKASTGAYTTTTVTLANTSYKGAISLALKPAPSTITVGTTGTQTANMNIPSTNQYVGGAWTFVRNESTANVTSITISETDATLSAQSYLANLDLYYETAGTCTYDGVETLFGTDTAFDASEDAVITGTMAVGTSQVCVYAVVDVVTGAPNADTFDLEITNPSTEVAVSAGVVGPATAVAISGATTINLLPNVFQDHYRWRNDNGPQGDTSQTLYFNPTGNGFGTADFAIVATACAVGSEWDCVDDDTTDTASVAPTSDLETSELTLAAATDYYTLANDALPSGVTVTQLDITVAGADDVGNPNTSITLGYCVNIASDAVECSVADAMGSAQAINGADQTKTQQFTGLSINTTRMNAMELVLTGSGAKAEISTLYVLVTYTVPAATWAQVEDAVHTGLAKSTNIRLRFQVDNTGGSANSYNYRLEWAAQSVACDTAYSGESYAAVPDVATTEHFDMTLSGSSLYVDGDPTTAQLSNAESYTFVAGDTVESTSNQSGAITLANNQHTEVEYVFQANANATDGGVYCFRVTNAGTALNSADIVAQVTLAGGGGGYLYFVVKSASETFPNLIPGTLIATSSILEVRTDNSTGFNITVLRQDSDTTLDLNTDASVNIPDKTAWAPGANCSTAGNASASTTESNTLQFRTRQTGTDSANYCSAWWGINDTTASALFAGFSSTAQQIIYRSTSAVASTTSIVLYNLNAPSTQRTGAYSGSITYTAAVNP